MGHLKSARRKVYIVNKSGHDFSGAAKYGEFVFLSNGLLRKRNITYMARLFEAGMIDSSSEDYILPTSLSIMSTVAALVFARKHGHVNFLIFEDGKYKERTLDLNNICNEEGE